MAAPAGHPRPEGGTGAGKRAPNLGAKTGLPLNPPLPLPSPLCEFLQCCHTPGPPPGLARPLSPPPFWVRIAAKLNGRGFSGAISGVD